MKRIVNSTRLARSLRGAWCCSVAMSLVCGAAGQARAEAPALVKAPVGEDVAGAEAFAAQAFQAYVQRDYERAVALYLQAYEAAPTADILYNIARVHDVGLQDIGLSISFYQDYVIAPDAEPYRAEIARERIKQLSAIESAVRQRSAPQAGAPSSAGAATGAGGVAAPVTRPGRPNREAAAVTDVDAWTPWHVGALVAGGLGVVSIGLGAGFGVAALSDAATAREDCEGDVCSTRRGVEAARAAAKSADIATVGFALGGGLLAASLVSLLFDFESPSDHDSLRSSLRPVATASELGVAMSGRW